jgi:hypothetical protein
MDAREIPVPERGLGICHGCPPNRHYCSWVIDGQYYCETCADKKRGIEKVEELAPDVVIGNAISAGANAVLAYDSAQFALKPNQTYSISIGRLTTGWVLSIDNENHVYPTKGDMIGALDGMLVVREVDDEQLD